MDWFIHIGTEKTGSSHIQSIMALSRDDLARNGFAFPQGWRHDERCMRRGQISAGNARSLAMALSDDDETATRRQIDRARKAAARSSASRVVLSSEWLLSSLADRDNVRMLLTLLREAGATSVSFLLVLRDPLEQCLSLYKHRAKRGTAGAIADWVEKGYTLPLELRAFREQLDAQDADLVVRGHSKAPGTLEGLFFDDWLGLLTPPVELPATVNPSLTLSELVLIRHMAEVRSELVTPLYDALAAVPAEHKTQGEALEAHARAVAAQAVAAHADEWAAWNERLPANERLIFPDDPEQVHSAPEELGLSERQMLAISELLGRSATAEFVAGVFWRARLRPALGQLKKQMFGR